MGSVIGVPLARRAFDLLALRRRKSRKKRVGRRIFVLGVKVTLGDILVAAGANLALN